MSKKLKGIKNYLILGAMIIITFIITIYALSWYKQYNDTKLGVPVISSVLAEVNYDELDNILKERDIVILYMCTSSELKCRNFEVKFKKYIKAENLNSDIIYFNLGDYKDENDILDKIYNKYKSEDLLKKLNNYPSILIFNEGELIDLLSPSSNKELSINKVDSFLQDYEF